MKKVLINGKEVDLTDSTHWELKEVKESALCKVTREGQLGLYNCNTKKFEGIDGDLIEYHYGNKFYRGHVIGYTCFQFVCTAEYGKVILSAYDAYNHMKVIEHNGEILEV